MYAYLSQHRKMLHVVTTIKYIFLKTHRKQHILNVHTVCITIMSQLYLLSVSLKTGEWLTFHEVDLLNEATGFNGSFWELIDL